MFRLQREEPLLIRHGDDLRSGAGTWCVTDKSWQEGRRRGAHRGAVAVLEGINAGYETIGPGP